MVRLSSLKDPRWYQILVLTSLLAFGMIAQAFEISITQIAAIMITALGTQWLGSTLFAIRTDLKSPLITALSLSLLLRADGIMPLMIAAAIAIGSKFLFRIKGKHLFNPANFGIVVVVLLMGSAWTTPGQWGTAIWFAALLAGVGMFVTYRAARIDVPLIFLATFTILIFIRALWLGDPLSIPLLRLQNGALILFAFFMISDPKTTPDTFWGRMIFATGAAILAYIMTYHFYLNDGLFYALAIMTLIRPIMDILAKAPAYQWGDKPQIFTDLATSKPSTPIKPIPQPGRAQ